MAKWFTTYMQTIQIRTDEAQARWQRDMVTASKSVSAWLVTIDGEQFIDPSCPAGLARYYNDLRSLGYAKGWAA